VRDATAEGKNDGPVVVKSEYLDVMPKQDRVVTDKFVTIADPRGTVSATGLELDNKVKTVKFKSRVSGQLEPQHQSP